jgi:hypothetical protein
MRRPCLKCKKQAPGAYYRFFVRLRNSLSQRIVHEENAFLCDRCARAQLRFAPLVVLLLWVPALASGVLLTGYRVLVGLRLLYAFGMGPIMRNTVLLLLACLLLLYVTVRLIRLAWRQLDALRYGQYHHPPFSGPVARLAIQLRKRAVLRSLHLDETKVTFLTEEGRHQGRTVSFLAGRS